MNIGIGARVTRYYFLRDKMKSENDIKIEVTWAYHMLCIGSWPVYWVRKQLEEKITTLCWVVDDDDFTDKMMGLLYQPQSCLYGGIV